MIQEISRNNFGSFWNMLQKAHHAGRTIKVGIKPQREIYQLINSIRMDIKIAHYFEITGLPLNDT